MWEEGKVLLISMAVVLMFIALLLAVFAFKSKRMLFKVSLLMNTLLLLVASGFLFVINNDETKTEKLLTTVSAFLKNDQQNYVVAAETDDLMTQDLVVNEANVFLTKPAVGDDFAGPVIKDNVELDAPLVEQLPELPRGCEVTSLCMLLAYHDIHADKSILAEEVKRNPATFERKDGKVYFGNPHNGFVGDMYAFDTPGLGVYHKPIAELAKEYAENKTVLDFTGEDFDSIKEQLSMERPVWVIINSHYQKLPDSQFQTWHTEDGPIEITYRQHSVLVTGYDDEYVYFNDPLNYHHKADIKHFEDAWIQMGQQAITIY